MFDWNDEELANIVWAEEGESDDHIVPYREASEDVHNKKEWNQEASAIKLIELKGIEAKTDCHGRKLGSSSKLDKSVGVSASGYGTNSWPDLSLSSAARTDQSSLEETAQPGKDVEIFRSTHEDKEQSDFVDYAWDNIGSFDDLDRIFSNDNPIFGHVNPENSDELWSSKDESNSPVPILSEAPSPASALRSRSEPLEIKAKYVHHRNDRAFYYSFKRIDDSASHDTRNAHATTVNVGYARGRSTPTEKEQQDMVGMTASVPLAFAVENAATANGLTDMVKQEGKIFQDFYDNWSPSTTPSGHFGNQLAPSVMQSSPSSILGQQKQLQGPETLYQNLTNTHVESSVYGNLTNTYPAMSMLPQAQSGVLRQQPLLSGYEVSPAIVNPVQKYVDLVKPLTMTPQEKIEKLRRRQQMRAMLAIQKQQQQLGHQVPSTNKTMTKEMQSHLCTGADHEIKDLRTLPALDPPAEHDTISAAIDNHFVEETVLYMLQDIISKLDVKIRLCIRDSLFRLAQSATQRHSTSDSSHTNKSSREEPEVVAGEESDSQTRYASTADVETETNPIDRTVAHLLFHMPLELTGNYSDKLDSPISSKMHSERKSANLDNIPTGCLPYEDLKSSQQFSHQGHKNSCSLFDAQPMDEFKNSHCIDTSENASNNEPADVGDHQELEASQ